MNKQIHFFPYSADVNADNYYATEFDIKHNTPFITTNQMSFLSTDLLDAGYEIWIHEDDWFVYQITYGRTDGTKRYIRPGHDLFKLWKAGEFYG